MNLRIGLAALTLSTFLIPTPARSHHSNVAFEVTKVLTITGVVRDFKWTNPHTWIQMTVDDGKGNKVDWAVEGRAPSVLLRAGWTRSSVIVMVEVTAVKSPCSSEEKIQSVKGEYRGLASH